jgi:hypothetical protein
MFAISLTERTVDDDSWGLSCSMARMGRIEEGLGCEGWFGAWWLLFSSDWTRQFLW